MAYNYHYYRGADGQRFCYAAEPTYQCPLAEPGATGSAAEALGCDAAKLAQMIRRAHSRSGAGRDRDADGRLTERCQTCGAKLVRVGYAAWAEEPDPEEYRERIAERLGFDRPMRQSKPRRYFDVKREAMAWAREEAAISKAVAEEAV